MNDRTKGAVLASFAADSLALGVHWIYNTRTIEKKFGRVETLIKPGVAKFHEGKDAGDLTHYGDQMLVLLDSVAACGGFRLDDFAHRWQQLFKDYNGYLDHATKDTLSNLSGGMTPEMAGSGSTDLGGASRIAPLVAVFGDDAEKLVAAARSQTELSHAHPDVVNSAEFFARAAASVLEGRSPVEVFESLAKDNVAGCKRWVEQGLDSVGEETRDVVEDFGQMCEVGAAMPSVVHLVGKYENDLKEALIENVMAGGDSAARGMLTGLLLGAHHGVSAVPETWIRGMKARDRILEDLKALESLSV